VPSSYEFTVANVAGVTLTAKLPAGADLREDLARRLLGKLAYRSEKLEAALVDSGIRPVTEDSAQGGKRQ